MGEGGRGLDHLIEQNSTELDFLAAYGGGVGSSSTTPEAIFEALTRYLKAGGVKLELDESSASFSFGKIVVTKDGCEVSFSGKSLPLVNSDIIGQGFANGVLSKDRSDCQVIICDWEFEQRRFIERIVEFFQS